MTAYSLLYWGGFNAAVNNPLPFPLDVTLSGGTASLNWPAQAGAYEYSVLAGQDDEPLVPIQTGLTSPGATIAGLGSGIYAFVVVAKLGDRQEAASQLVRNVGHTTLVATPDSQKITLAVTPVFGATGYNVYLGTVSGQESPIPLPQTQQQGTPWAQPVSGGFVVQNLTNGTSYFLQVQPTFGSWWGQSTEIGATPSLAGPTSLAAIACDGRINLTWNAVAGSSSYNIYQGTSPGGEGSSPVQSGITGNSTTVSSLTDGTAYYFTAKAVVNSVLSNPSNEASATPVALGTPTGLNVTPNPATASFLLTWSAATAAASYNVYAGTSPGGEGSSPVATGITTTTFNTPSTFETGVTYYFTVKAVNPCGQISAASNEASGYLSSYAVAVLQDAPLLYYRMDGTGSVETNLGSLGSALDMSIQPGVIVNQSGLLAGDPSACMLFSEGGGTTYYLSVPISSSSGVPVDDFTIEALVAPHGVIAADGTIIRMGSRDTVQNGYEAVVQSAGQETSLGTDTLNVMNSGGGTYQGGYPRNYICMTYKASGLQKIRQNSLIAITGSSTHLFSLGAGNPNLLIGGYEGVGGFLGSFTGFIQEVAIYAGYPGDNRSLLKYAIATGSQFSFNEDYNVTNVGELALSNGNRTIASAGGFVGGVAFSLGAAPAGLSKVEFAYTAQNTPATTMFAVGIASPGTDNTHILGFTSGGFSYRADGVLFNNNVPTFGLPTLAQGDVVGVLIDNTNGKLWFTKNGVSIQGNPVTGSNPCFTFTPGTWYAAAWAEAVGTQITIAQLASQFANPAPTGFSQYGGIS